MSEVPAFVTHYYRAGRHPFLNLSELPEDELATVAAGLGAIEQQPLSHRRFGSRYMGLRRATEARARELFIAVGGRPQRRAPHYFVLCVSAWSAGLYRDVAEIRLPTAALPYDTTSFTYGDSITALALGQQVGVPAPDPAHRDRLYRLDQLTQVVACYGLPEDRQPDTWEDYLDHQHRRLDQYIEVQLWSDAPVRAYLST